ncbi:hypothetical protein D3C87_1299790 [compost metagenome]
MPIHHHGSGKGRADGATAYFEAGWKYADEALHTAAFVDKNLGTDFLVIPRMIEEHLAQILDHGWTDRLRTTEGLLEEFGHGR